MKDTNEQKFYQIGYRDAVKEILKIIEIDTHFLDGVSAPDLVDIIEKLLK